MTVTCAKRRLPLVALSDTDSVVCILEIQLGEVPCPRETIHDLTYQGQRVSILDGYIVQTPVVNAQA
jgi:hypothetical protein